jgi:parvulin-like peptidyl-prolyl isomerase
LANKKKKKSEKPPRELTRRQLSQYQRQTRRQRIITIAGISIIVVVILTVLVGWYQEEYRPMHRTVIRVNDTKLNMKYYVDAISVTGKGKTLDNIVGIAGGIIREIEQSELIRQAALKLGISVSDDEAREKLSSLNMTVNKATLDMAREQILLERLQDEYFENQVPKTAAQVHMLAMMLESESQAYEIRDRLQNSENFTALAEEFSLNSYTKEYQGDLGWHPESIFEAILGSSVPGEYAFGSEVGALSQPRYDAEISKQLGYWLVRVLEREDEDTAQVQAILLGSEEEAQSVSARLEAGEDLAALAQELSQYEESKNQGGELGLVRKGEMSSVVDEFIFNAATENGTWSAPIRDDTVATKGAYWLIEVVDRDDNRQLESADRDYLLSQALSDWSSSLWLDPANTVDHSRLDGDTQRWAAERVEKG